ncbi:MAG: SNF2 helicase associated domain-containing protein [Blautia sp.]|nr:SNF2 helicase associated domain-containing protein [Blautia sp.]
MRIQRYFRAFSLEELCAGMELVLSGEGKTSFRTLNPQEREALFPGYDSECEILQLVMDYSVYQGKEKKKRQATVWVDGHQELVLKTRCTCQEYQKDSYGCSHTAAAWTAWYIEQEGTGFFYGSELETRLKNLARVEDPFAPGVLKRTDSRLLPYLKEDREENTLPVWGKKKVARKDLIHLEYDIFADHDCYYMSLRAGVDRKYVVKDIIGFVQCYLNEGVYNFGKTGRVLSGEFCDGFANGLIGIIAEAYEHMRDTYRNKACFAYQGNSKDARYFVLDGYYMGKFLRLLDGTHLVYADGRQVPVRLDRKGLEATLRKVANGAVFQVKTIKLVADDGVSLYLEDAKGIFAVSSLELGQDSFIRNVLFIKDPLYIREADIPALCQNILPLFEKYGHVNRKGMEPGSYEREVPEQELYLDIENKSCITCVPYSVYKEPEARYRLFDNTSGVQQRNGAVENGYAKELIGMFQEYDSEEGRLSAVLEDEEMYQFLQETLPQMQEKATVYITDRLKKMKVQNLPKLQVKISMKSSGLTMDLKGTDLSKQELEEILSNYSVKRKYYRLKNGSFFKFEEEDSQLWDAIADLYRHHGTKDAAMLKLPLYRAAYLQEMMKEREGLLLETDSHYQNLIRTMGEEENSLVPASLAPVLRPYQEEGFHWIKRLKSIGFGGILADDMGLGKTLQVLSFLLSEKQSGKSGRELRTLIICPASLVYNWQKEIMRFTPELTNVVVAGTQAARQQLIEQSGDVDVWITSYDLLKRDVAYYENIPFANEIIDEAQFIKNQNTQAAQSVRIVSADFRMALTGTPIENHLGELWSILDYLMPGFLYTYTVFQKEFQTPIMNDQDEGSMDRLRRMVHPFILRRLKKDVLKELPEKLEETVLVKLEKEQKQLYDAYAARLRQSLAQKSDAEFRSQKLEVLAELTRLRQLCCDPSLLMENYHGGSAKLDACLELVGQAVEGGHKVLLFSQFTSMLDIICQRLTQAGHAYYRIDGSVSKEKRMEMVDSFAYDEVPVFCISLKAGGTGLNLTAADIVIHYDPWWNQAAQNQATDRAHRIGQQHSVSVYELIAGDTIEEQIQNIKQDKAQLMEDVLSGERIASSSLKREELLQLLEEI